MILMDPAKVNQEVDPLRVNRTREKRFVVYKLASSAYLVFLITVKRVSKIRTVPNVVYKCGRLNQSHIHQRSLFAQTFLRNTHI